LVEKFPTVLEKLPQVLKGGFFYSHCRGTYVNRCHVRCRRALSSRSQLATKARVQVGFWTPILTLGLRVGWRHACSDSRPIALRGKSRHLTVTGLRDICFGLHAVYRMVPCQKQKRQNWHETIKMEKILPN